MAIDSTISGANKLSDEVWSLIHEIINEDATVSSKVSSGYVGDSYPQQFLDDASKKLPLVIVHRPKITEEKLTMTKKKFNISIQLESVSNTSESVKQLSDAVRNSLESQENATRGQKLYNFMITAHDERFEIRDNKRVHFDILTASYQWLGGGALD